MPRIGEAKNPGPGAIHINEWGGMYEVEQGDNGQQQQLLDDPGPASENQREACQGNHPGVPRETTVGDRHGQNRNVKRAGDAELGGDTNANHSEGDHCMGPEWLQNGPPKPPGQRGNFGVKTPLAPKLTTSHQLSQLVTAGAGDAELGGDTNVNHSEGDRCMGPGQGGELRKRERRESMTANPDEVTQEPARG